MPVKNEKGNIYGRITVGDRAPNNERGDAQWYCHCECGTDFITKGVSLRAGHTQSCGCLQKDKVREQGYKNTADLIGKHFGKLEVVERIVGDKNNIGKWRCICECGGETITTTDKLISGHTQSCGCIMSQQVLLITKFLDENNFNFSKEYTFSDLKSNKNYALRFDFALFKENKLQCLIEYDGKQHFDSTNFFWNESTLINDNLKNEYCLNNNIPLYRITYKQNSIEELKIILMKEGFQW